MCVLCIVCLGAHQFFSAQVAIAPSAFGVATGNGEIVGAAAASFFSGAKLAREGQIVGRGRQAWTAATGAAAWIAASTASASEGVQYAALR